MRIDAVVAAPVALVVRVRVGAGEGLLGVGDGGQCLTQSCPPPPPPPPPLRRFRRWSLEARRRSAVLDRFLVVGGL